MTPPVAVSPGGITSPEASVPLLKKLSKNDCRV
jgi:hypothetical protein